MALAHNPSIVTSGLVYYHDISNTQKSYIGKPITNQIAYQNARTDATYAPYVKTVSGTWAAKHPDAITIYSVTTGADISDYSNTGIGDWTNTYHAIWTYDSILQRPVVTMRDVDGQWKAKSFSLGLTGTAMGLSVGSKYTISWLQWVDNINHFASAGLYTINTANTVTDFYDGLSGGSATSRNTLANTWQRVYHTFTVQNTWNLTSTNTSIFMYGHQSGVRATCKIADVQFEVNDHMSGFVNGLRTNTGAILDLTGNQTVTANSLTYTSSTSVSFNGSTDYISTSNTGLTHGASEFTYGAWINFTALTSQGTIFENGFWTSTLLFRFENNLFTVYSMGQLWASFSFTPTLSTWYNIAFIRRSNTIYFYVNGVETASAAFTATVAPSTSLIFIGMSQHSPGQCFNGKIDVASIYNRALTATEVTQNFAAHRSRYGV